MTHSLAPRHRFGTFTVFDMLLFVAACSVSLLLIRLMRPPAATQGDYLLLLTCGPAGLSVFGPWAVRRQFVDSSREELQPGEWLWIVLGGAWTAAMPLMLATGSKGVVFLASLIALCTVIPGIVALVQSLPTAHHYAWTHWAGILLCLVHGVPVIDRACPLTGSWIDRIIEGLPWLLAT